MGIGSRGNLAERLQGPSRCGTTKLKFSERDRIECIYIPDRDIKINNTPRDSVHPAKLLSIVVASSEISLHEVCRSCKCFFREPEPSE